MYLLEPLVELALVIENRPTGTIVGPRNGWKIWVGAIATGKHFVSCSHWIEEVDGVAPRDAVPGWADVDRYAMEREDVCRATDMIPIIEPETEVMKTAIDPLCEGNVVGPVTALKEGDDLVPSAIEELLGEPEVKNMLEEPAGFAYLFSGHEHMIEPGRGDTDHSFNDRAWVGQTEP